MQSHASVEVSADTMSVILSAAKDLRTDQPAAGVCSVQRSFAALRMTDQFGMTDQFKMADHLAEHPPSSARGCTSTLSGVGS